MRYLHLPTTRFGFKLMLVWIAAASAAAMTAALLLIYTGRSTPVGASMLAVAENIYIFLLLSFLIFGLGRYSNGGPLLNCFFYLMLPPLGLQTWAILMSGDTFQVVLLVPGIPLWLVLTWIVEDRGRALFRSE